MQGGEEKIVAERLHELLSKKRNPKPEMSAPAADMSGRWNVNIKFFSSTSQHVFYIEQNGNWLQGTHKGDLNVRNMAGTVEGNQVKLRSSIPMIGDMLSFIFSGQVLGNIISGEVYFGEYGTAEFIATRNTAKPAHQKVMIPQGPPLAT